MMHRALVDTKLVDPSGNETRERSDYVFKSVNDVELGYFYTFKGDGRVVVYLASAVAEEIDIKALIDNLKDTYDGHHVHATKISVVDGDDPLDSDADGKMVALNADDLNDPTLDLAPNELIQIEFTMGKGVDLMGDDQTATDDVLIGTDFGDSLVGNLGNDTLYGNDGNDRLEGKDGNDRLWGGEGKDTVHGQNGHDMIWGGNGNDQLSAGGGDDTV